MSDIPWVEKYRPSSFDDIVLDKINQSIFCNILEKEVGISAVCTGRMWLDKHYKAALSSEISCLRALK